MWLEVINNSKFQEFSYLLAVHLKDFLFTNIKHMKWHEWEFGTVIEKLITLK